MKVKFKTVVQTDNRLFGGPQYRVRASIWVPGHGTLTLNTDWFGSANAAHLEANILTKALQAMVGGEDIDD